MADIVSGATRRAFQESYVSNSVLNAIAADFDDAGVQRGALPEGKMTSGQRRELVEEYYCSVTWDDYSSVRPVLNAFETHLLKLQQFNQDEYARLAKHLRRDGFTVEDGRITLPGHELRLDDVVDHKLGVDLHQLRINIARIRAAIDQDPALAIGSAKELVESTCKAILAGSGQATPEKADLPDLVGAVLQHLELTAKAVAPDKKGAQSIRRVLGSLSQIVQGLAELRNLYGSGHGKGPNERGLSPRHARLCAGAAATLATFLMETTVQRESD